MAKTISHCQGKGSLAHNNRKFAAKNVDSSRTENNIVFVEQPIATAYDKIFGAAVERYNAKQKRSDRKIRLGYYEHVFKRSPAQSVVTSADKRKSFYEDVVQIGTMQDTGVGTPDAEVAAACLTEYMQGFQERNPNFYVFNAVMHLDEATPHLHIDYIPVGHYKQGVDTQNGIAQALKEMGYGTGKDAISRWRERERAVLEGICKTHGIEISAPQKSRGSLVVEEYKEYAHISEKVNAKQNEMKQLEGEIGSKELILEWRQRAVVEAEEIIDRIDTDYQEKNATIERLNAELSEKNTALTETAAELANNQALLETSAQKVSQIKSIDSIETGKTVFGGKVTVARDDYDKLTDLAKKQIAAESKENSLQARIKVLETQNQALITEKDRLTEQNSELRNENGKLQSVYGHIAISKLRAERDNLQRQLDRVMKFIKSLGLVERLQAFLNSTKRLHK